MTPGTQFAAPKTLSCELFHTPARKVAVFKSAVLTTGKSRAKAAQGSGGVINSMWMAHVCTPGLSLRNDGTFEQYVL